METVRQPLESPFLTRLWAIAIFSLAIILVTLTASTAMAQTDTDNDGDGISDDREIELGTDPGVSDTDGDGLTDGFELTIGTNPLNPDTDNDGATDTEEYLAGFDPLVFSPGFSGAPVTRVPATVPLGSDGETTTEPFIVSPETAGDGAPDGLAFNDAAESGPPIVLVYPVLALAIAVVMVAGVARLPELHADKPS